jgi:MFS family permease
MSSDMARRNGPAAPIMLVATLVTIYAVSQFLRNSIGVIAPNLAQELELSPGEIGLLSSIFFFVFAAVQIPLGVLLDRFGARACLGVGAAITVVGCVVFAWATSPLSAMLGRALLGVGTAGSLVASLAVYAGTFPPARFAMLTGLHIGLGTLGTLIATAPLAYAAATIGWRESFLLVGAFTLLIGLAVVAVLRGQVQSVTPMRKACARASPAFSP